MKNYQKIAGDRIKILFKKAGESFKSNPERSHRYVELARKISMKTKTKIPASLKKKSCKHCNKFLMPGFNCRVRTRDKKLIYYCMECKKYSKMPLLIRSNSKK